MILKCIKNYLYSLRLILAVLGILFLGLLIGGGILYRGADDILDQTSKQIKEISGDKNMNSDALMSEIIEAFRNETAASSKDATVIISAIDDNGDNCITSKELEDVVIDSVSNAISNNVEGYEENIPEISAVITDSIMNFYKLALIFGIFSVISIVICRIYVVTMAKTVDEHPNPMRQMVVRCLHDIVIFATFICIFCVFDTLPIFGLILILLYPIIYSLMSLLVAYFTISKKHRAPIGNIVNVKNIFILLLCNILELIIAVGIAYAIVNFFSMIVALYLLTALVIITSAAGTLSAETIAICASDDGEAQIYEDPDFINLESDDEE